LNLNGKRILLTGGAGFIGSQLARRLIETSEVVILDNVTRDALRFTNLREHPRVTFIQGDVLDAGAVRAAAKGCHAIIHLAAIAGVDAVMNRLIDTMVVNFEGTLNVLRAAEEHRVERLVDFSTSEVFGAQVYKAEEHGATSLGRVGESRWTYAVSKLAAEHLVHSFHREKGVPTVSVRPFNVYGPQQVGIGAIHVFCVAALRGEDIVIHGDGTQIRAWCYVDDMVDGALLCLTRDEAVGHVFNIGNPEGTITVAHLAALVNRLAGGKSPVRYDRKPYVDVELRIPSIEKARERLGFEPRVDLETGIARTLEWYRETGID
jgi:nucleoside-diphosphate-sugar epimerase